MIVLEHTNPLTIYLDYHYWLSERGASGDMTGGEYSRLTSTGPFNSCNPRPIGEPGLGSPLTKNKSTFSDYHSRQHEGDVITYGCGYMHGSLCGIFFDDDWPDVSGPGSRLSKN